MVNVDPGFTFGRFLLRTRAGGLQNLLSNIVCAGVWFVGSFGLVQVFFVGVP